MKNRLKSSGLSGSKSSFKTKVLGVVVGAMAGRTVAELVGAIGNAIKDKTVTEQSNIADILVFGTSIGTGICSGIYVYKKISNGCNL
jgi:hypothetical protein